MKTGLMSERPLISIIIPTFRSPLLEHCVRSILLSDYDNFEIIVVENGSESRCSEFLHILNSACNAKIIKNNINLGYAGACNVGFKYATGDILIFLNDDTVVKPDWLSELIKVFLLDPAIGAAQCKLLQMQPPGIDSLGQNVDYLGYGYPIKDQAIIKAQNEIFYADGAALCVKRQALNKSLIDGLPFDDDYFSYYEDNDLSWRIRLAGYKIVIVANSIVFHSRSPSRASELNTFLTFHHTKNRFSTLIKNYDTQNVIKYVPILFLTEIVRAGFMMLIKPSHALAILAGILWTLKHIKRIYLKRKIVQVCIRRIPDRKIKELMISTNFSALRKFASLYYPKRKNN